MTRSSKAREPAAVLLITESKDEFDALKANLHRELLPRNIVEQIYTDDIIALTWETLRLRRCKAAIVNVGFRKALQKLLSHHLDIDYGEAVELAQRWFSEAKARKEVADILAAFMLDESAIEAEAIRLSSQDLEVIDRMLAALESRRNKAIRNIEDYRVSFAKTVREVSDRVLQADDSVLTLDHQSKKSA